MAAHKNTNRVPMLVNWSVLNAHLRTMENPKDAWRLLVAEKGGKNRMIFVNRIYGRFSVLRERLERQELGLVS